jgi:preprotein translocase subunit SecF
MEFFKPGITYDFFKYRWWFISASALLVGISLLSFVYPGPRFGIDFKGGTEVELEFTKDVTPTMLREAVEALDFGAPEVVSVEGATNRYILRLQQVSSLPQAQVDKARKALDAVVGEGNVLDFTPSPGGDKLAIQVGKQATPEQIQQALVSSGLNVREVSAFGSAEDQRYEAHLVGIGEKLIEGLKQKLGNRAPAAPLRVEWVGPKAGQQLRTAALNSILYVIAFIMVYIAFRFDLRFAPGGVLALAHDAIVTLGVYTVLQKEITLATIAAVLTVVGFSINDTIVIYDRIRENMQRMRDASLVQLINVSTSQTLGRTVITSGMVLISISGFYIWGTPMIQDITFALTVGFLVGSYSTIYVAAPLTEWMDRRFFRKV